MGTNVRTNGVLFAALAALLGACADPADTPDSGTAPDAAGVDGGVVLPRVVAFATSAAEVERGEGVLVTFEIEPAADVTLTREGDVTEVLLSGTVSSGEVKSGALGETTTFRLVARANGATVERTLTVEVRDPDVRIVRFDATPNPAPRRSRVVVRWEVEGATEVRVLEGATLLAATSTAAARGELALDLFDGRRKLRLEASNAYVTRTRGLEVVTTDRGRIAAFEARPPVFREPARDVELAWDARGETIELLADGAPLMGFSRDIRTSSVTVPVSRPSLFTLVTTGFGRVDVARRVVAPGALEVVEPDDGAPPRLVAGALGRLDGPGDVDRFRVAVPEGGSVIAQLSGGACGRDIGLRLLGPGGDEVVERDAGERGACAAIDPWRDAVAADLPAGEYVLEVDGRSVGAAYELAALALPAACGDGLHQVAAGEQCDDGNVASGDGCDARCRVEVVDTLQLPGPEVERRGALAAGVTHHYRLVLARDAVIAVDTGAPDADGCAGANTVLSVRDTRGVAIAEDDDGSDLCASLDPVSSRPLPAGVYLVSVRAFNADASIAAYTVRAREVVRACGDGRVTTGEACDDGNLAAGDGCDARCEVEVLPAGGGRVAFSLAPGAVGAIDVEVTAPGQSLTATTSDGAGGCGREATLVVSRDRVVLGYEPAQGGCPRLSGRTHAFAADLSPGLYRVQVRNEASTVATIALDVGLTEPACGNGLRERRAGEQCDDGNLVEDDGCTATCQRTSGGRVVGPGGPPVILAGEVPNPGDQAVFELELTAPGYVRADLGVPVIGLCTGADPTLTLLDAGGNPLAFNDDFNGLCSVLDPVFTGSGLLAPGVYTLVVQGFSGQAVPAFEVRVELLPVGCGNGIPEPGEACDDGNLVAGDGCSASCALEP